MNFINGQDIFLNDNLSYNEALLKSKAENKPIFIMLYANWCPHCNVMKNTVFNKPDIINYLNTNFITLYKDADKEEAAAIKSKFGTKALPYFLFIDSNETVLYGFKGELKADDFIKECNRAKDIKFQLPTLEAKFKADKSNSVNFLNYLLVLRKGKDKSELSTYLTPYFETQSEQQLISELNWRIISNGVMDIQSKEIQFVLKNKEQFAAVASKERIEKKMVSLVKDLLKPSVEIQDTIAYQHNRLIAKNIKLQVVDSTVLKYDFQLAESLNDWKKYHQIAATDVEKIAYNDASLLKEIGTTHLNHITNSNHLKLAVRWTKRSLDLLDSYDGNLLISRLYLKLGDRKNSHKYAILARNWAEKLTFNTKMVDDLLTQIRNE